MTEKNIMISLDDERAKYISEVLGNKSCKKIINFLTETDATVSDIARELKMPINTTDYNVKKLEKSGLIEKKSFWWSTRGKKMPTYTVSNKKIIISPKKKKNLAKYIYSLIITGLTAIILRYISLNDKTSNLLGSTNKDMQRNIIKRTTESLADEARGGILNTREITNITPTSFINTTTTINNSLLGLEIWAWFLIGAWMSILIFFLISFFTEKKEYQ